MKKHYETHVEDTDKLISVAGPVLDYKSWYEQYRKLMEEQAQRKYGLYTPTSEGDDDDFPSIPGMIARYSASGLTNEQMAANPVWVDKTGNGYDLQLKNFTWGGMSGVGGYEYNFLSSDWVVGKVQLSEALSYKITIVDKKNSVQLFKYIRNEDDKIVSSVFIMGKDFTIVGDWKFIDNKKSGTGLVKGSSFYIYNTMTGLDLYINSGSVKNSLDGIKSINAACSDGRAYDRNWNEILANTGNVVGSGGMLEVSSSGGRFDRIAFKNLAIYPRILSKDDCIKAYNYLQTLKSK